MPKISVIMSAYNAADTVVQSLDALYAQTYADFEIILCDDASTDGTHDLLAAYAKKKENILLLTNPQNSGLSFSLNRCLEHAKGEFCARMDADDLCDPERFAKQLRFLESNPQYGFVSTTMIRFDENGVYETPAIGDGYEPTRKQFAFGSPFCHGPVMIRTQVLKSVGGYRDIPRTKGTEDYDLWFRLYESGFFGFVIEEPLYYMFDGRGAARRRTFKRRLNEAWVRWDGYKRINLPFPYRVFVLKPLILALLPKSLYNKLHKCR